MKRNKQQHPSSPPDLLANTGRLTRRSFVRVAMASAGAFALGSAAGDAAWAAKGGEPGKPGGGGGDGGGGGTARNPLYVPPTVTTPSSYAISPAPATVDLANGGGDLANVLAYNGALPGPTFQASVGDNVSMVMTNGLDEDTTIHWHGMVVPTHADGHPQDAVGPGGSYTYQYPIVQRAALNWYHPHPHGRTGPQVNLGLAGAFILRDTEEAALGLPSGAYEVPLVIRDAERDKSGNLVYKAKSSGFLGKIPLVNGTVDPTLAVDATLYRLRVLNGCNARVLRIAMENGAPFTVIGNDGGLLAAPAQVGMIEFGPGERLDLLVDLSGLAVGSTVMLREVNESWDLLEFNVTGTGSSGSTVPTGTLSSIAPLGSPVATREFSFDGMSRINGQTYDMYRIDLQVPYGQTERWVFVTGGNAPHPVHVHGASFQVVSRTGGRGQTYPWEGGWKDTVLLLDGETVEVLVHFDAYRGLYLLHCHQLEHEDNGMMSNFEVV